MELNFLQGWKEGSSLQGSSARNVIQDELRTIDRPLIYRPRRRSAASHGQIGSF